MTKFEFTEVMMPEQVALFQLCLALTTLEGLGYSLYHKDPVYLVGEDHDHELVASTSDDGATRWGYRSHSK